MKTLSFLLIGIYSISIHAQNPIDPAAFETEGSAIIKNMPKENSADSVVVRLSNGMLAVRDVSTINTSRWYLGKDTLDGIVFYLYKGIDGMDHGLIVSKTENAFPWQSVNSSVNANSSWDGNYNMEQMINSPAKTYIQGQGMGWYLPSIDELSLLWNNRFIVNRAMQSGGFTLLNQTSNYWSSTEFNSQKAWGISWELGSTTNSIGISLEDKDLPSNVRAIRSF